MIADDAFKDEIERGIMPFGSEYFSRRLQRLGTHTWASSDKGEIVGFILLTEGNVEVSAQIHLVAVDEKHRGKGIGTSLVGTALDYWMTLDSVKLKLGARPWNRGMRKICVELGFIPEAYLREEYLGEDLIQYAYIKETVLSVVPKVFLEDLTKVNIIHLLPKDSS